MKQKLQFMKTIKKLLILLVCIASFNTFAQEVIIENDNATGIFHVTSHTSVGQSFTATANGEITKIQVVSTIAITTTLVLYDGPLRTGPVLHTQSVNLTNTYTDNNNYTYTTIVLDTPIPVVNGNMYRFEFGLSNLVNDNAGNYLSGDMYDGGSLVTNNDLTFKVVQQLTIPKVIGIERLIPLTEGTTASTVTFRVTFNDPVENVDSTDFTLNTTTGGNINSISAVSTSVYNVEITGMTTVGIVGLDIKGVNGVVGSNDIISLANSFPLAATAPTSYETYTKTIKPVVTTTSATNITPTTATLGGNVTEDAGSSVTERGILYSTADNNPEIGDTDVTKVDNGTGTGIFAEDFTGFTANATYYYRAYAINSNGIGYGDIKTFTFNNALNFQSSESNLVSIPDNAAFDFSSGFTMEAWIRPNTFAGNPTIFSQYSATQRAFSPIIKSNGAVEVSISSTGNSEVYYITENKLTLNTWQHIALTYDGTSVQFYINGTEAEINSDGVTGTLSGAMHNSTEPILLGSRSNALFYEGDMDEVRIWTKALTVTEINNQKNKNISPTITGLVAYYKMNQGIAGGDNTAITLLTDNGVNGLNGTLTDFTRTGTISNFVEGVPGILEILTSIPDTNFEAFLEANAMGDGIANNQLVITANINRVTTLNVFFENIADLTGIEYFIALTTLNCSMNQLTSLNLSTNTALTTLNCNGNQLTSLDVSTNTALTDLICYSNQLTSLDVSTNTALTSLRCDINQLTSLDVSINTALTTLECQLNQLTSLDVSTNTALTSLTCNNNQLTSLDVAANTALTNLNCATNQLTSLDVATNTALTNLNCATNQLTSLDVVANTALTNLICATNQLTSLDVATNTALTNLNCATNQLTSLDVATNTALTNLNCTANQLTSLDVATNTALTGLNCDSNQLTSLNLSTNTALEILYCNNNQLTSLDIRNGTNTNIFISDFFNATNNPNLTCISVDDVTFSTTTWLSIDAQTIFSNGNCALTTIPDANFEAFLEANAMGDGIANNQLVTTASINTVTTLNANSLGIADLTGIQDFTALTILNCYSNDLTSLDVSANTALTGLYCSNNDLTNLDVSTNTMLTHLSFYSNLLTNLDVSTNIALTHLDCHNNSLTNLNISANTALTKLNCDSNQLTSLDVSVNTALTHLSCNNNLLTSLGVTVNTALTALSCNNNQLINLDVSTNTNLEFFVCSDNQLTSLDLSTNTNLGIFNCSINQLTSLDLRNGNNTIINTSDLFRINNNPNLTCVSVDNVVFSNNVWIFKDSQTYYSEDCDFLGVNDIVQNIDFVLYPNPASNTLYIKGNLSELTKVEIYNINSQLQKTVTSKLDQIDINSLESAVYFVKLYSNAGSKAIKLVKK